MDELKEPHNKKHINDRDYGFLMDCLEDLEDNGPYSHHILKITWRELRKVKDTSQKKLLRAAIKQYPR